MTAPNHLSRFLRDKGLRIPALSPNQRSIFAGAVPDCAPGRFDLANRDGLFQCGLMQSHEVLRVVFEQCNPKQVAAELGLSLSMIYKWAEPPEDGAGSGSTNPLDRVETLLRCSKDRRLVQWICQRAGGFFIQNPKVDKPHPEFLIPATNEIVQEFADLLAVIAAAAADNHISEREAKQIRSRWEELKSVTEGFVACCEEGNFRAFRERQAAKEGQARNGDEGR